MQHNINTVLETADTKNLLHHLLFLQSISQQLTKRSFMFKVRPWTMHSEDYIIVCSVITGRELVQ